MENKNTDICTSIDYQKALNEEALQNVNRLKMKENDKLKDLTNKDTELNDLLNNIARCLTKFDDATKQYDEIMEDTGVCKEFLLFFMAYKC